ncbi:hypothetical protein ElyMa_002578400 [Elysia marginata]|uniref:Uncharacterized protein n=1 Tax=Elysia marginata TaxID=1093978 RepID=A0AAV4GY63_9GAST|nr:hypothetical protein ElyMa_002578400 [Elysia marginata]
MTSGKEDSHAGDWGGLVIAGKAPTNITTEGGTATSEVADISYGGSVADDNSGVIKYLRLEYTGARYTDTKEFNGLSLFGVGSGTKIDYVQSYKGSDDGIEFFGGTVSASHLVSTDSGDDGIDFADGWKGTGEYWYVKNAEWAGIEGSNNGDRGGAEPMTDAKLNYISVVADPLPKDEEGAFYIKEGGGKWTATNIFVSGYTKKVLKVKKDDTYSITHLNAKEITFNPIQLADGSENAKKIDKYDSTTAGIITEGNNTGAGNGKELPEWAKGWTHTH